MTESILNIFKHRFYVTPSSHIEKIMFLYHKSVKLQT